MPTSFEPQARYGCVARETETHVHGYTVTQSEAQRGAGSAIKPRAVEHAGSHIPEPRRPHVALGACSVSPWAGATAVPCEVDMLGDAAAPASGACRRLERKVGVAKALRCWCLTQPPHRAVAFLSVATVPSTFTLTPLQCGSLRHSATARPHPACRHLIRQAPRAHEAPR